MSSRPLRRRVTVLAVLLVTVSLVAGCASGGTTAGQGTPGWKPLAAPANLPVIGDSHDAFDQLVKNTLSDVMLFWKTAYPEVSGGDPLPPLKGGLYSADANDPSKQVLQNGCLKQDPQGLTDNAFYCSVDDSIAWDRNPKHLLPVLAGQFGTFLAVMAFAHEFGHAVQERLGIFDDDLPTIDTESQADCAAGAFTAWALAGNAPHIRVTSSVVDEALFGYLQVRDKTPQDSSQISHGNGFDRLSAVADGIQGGVKYCYSDSYFDRKFTERAADTDSSFEQTGGNECFEEVVNPATPTSGSDPAACSGGGGLQPNLNAFWTAKAASISKKWTDVGVKEASAPPCNPNPGSQFGYCPDDNTVYYDTDYAMKAYNSLPILDIADNADASVKFNTPGDYSLGMLFVIAWGMAVRHQLFDRSLDDGPALLAATCYAGAYSESINPPPPDSTSQFELSAPDMDEATSAVLELVGQDQAFGARGTTGLQRIQYFVKGYNGGLSVC